MGKVIISDHPLVRSKLTQLREKTTSTKKFSELVRELSMLLAYEACMNIEVSRRTIETPLAAMLGWDLKGTIGLVPILRAGLGMVEGIRAIMPNVQVWHIWLRRDEETLQPIVCHSKLPDSSTTEACFVLDPMLATGGSAVAAIAMLKEHGVQRIKFIGLIGAPEGVDNLKTRHPDVLIHLASLDEKLDERGLIVPGLGDAGDRQFGTE
ncbi:MAG: uracil phosphoribosyltransferase [Patescibacteria group bacterium]